MRKPANDPSSPRQAAGSPNAPGSERLTAAKPTGLGTTGRQAAQAGSQPLPPTAKTTGFGATARHGDGDDSWTIEAQRRNPEMDAVCLPASGVGETPTPQHADLRARLENLEQSLRDMENVAVFHLDASLHRFLADKELAKQLHAHIVQTAVKVVEGQSATVQAAGAGAEAAITQRLAVGREQPSDVDPGAPSSAWVAHIEQGLGEVLRRLERKMDTVASLLDQARPGCSFTGSH